MSSTLNDTMGTAKNVVESAVESAKEGTEHAISTARSRWLDAVKAVTGIVATLRGLELNDGLGLVGLARRRAPFGAAAAFGAGVAVGAGLGVLFAPRAGAATRRAIWKQLAGLEHEAKNTLDRAESEVKDAGEKVEELAGKAKDAVKKAERKVEGKVSAGAEAAKEAVRSTADAAAKAVTNKVEDAKSVIYAATDHSTSPSGGEANKPARSPRGVSGGHRPS